MIEYPQYFRLTQEPQNLFVDFLIYLGLWVVLFFSLVFVFNPSFEFWGCALAFGVTYFSSNQIETRWIKTRVFITAEETNMTVKGTRRGFGIKLDTVVVEWEELAKFKYDYPSFGPECVYILLNNGQELGFFGAKLESFYQFLRIQCPGKEQL